MFCNACATPIPTGGIFCPQCGKKVIFPAPPLITPPPAVPSYPPVPLQRQPEQAPRPDAAMQQQGGSGSPTHALPPPVPPVRKSARRRERRRERRRHARGFWYAPPVNFIILALAAVGWYFIPTAMAAYITDIDFSNRMARWAQEFQHSSPRDLWDANQSAVITLVLVAALLVLTIMALCAIYRLVKRWAVVSRRKKEWKREKRELLRKELSE